MATIVEMINPLTGLPEQVDKLDHTAQEIDDAVGRSLPGAAIDAAINAKPNPNLLDNGYFGNPVNQRGQTEYTGDGYTIDRWRIGTGKNMALSISDDKLSIVTDTVDSYFNFEQSLEAKVFRVGATYTLSFLVDNYRNINQLYFSAVKSIFIFTDNLVTMTFTVDSLISSNPFIGIQFKTNTTTSLFAAKLELGSTQTLAHREGDRWILNEVPDYGEQLRRCQMYYLGDMQRNAPGRISREHAAYCIVPIPVTMRQSSATPIQVFSDFGAIVDKDGATHVVNNASCVVEADSYLLFFVSSADTMPPGPCIWQDAHFSISKDL